MAKKSSSGGWFIIVLILIAIAVVLYQRQRRQSSYRIESAPAGQVVSENHLAPSEDLEQIDLDRLDHAQHTLDLAMYAFTDKRLGDELRALARRGVRIRIYRDGDQFESEQRNAEKYNEESVMDSLHGQSGIQIRVKPASRRDLMHLKVYAIDGKLLRDGSANWSLAGEKEQDNNARFTNDPQEIKNFEQDFDQMWARSSNTQVQ